MRIPLILAIVLAGAALFWEGSAIADEGDIEVVTTGAESQFPDGVKFTITARSSEEIDDIRVFFRKAEQSGISAYRIVEFDPGIEVDGESILASGGGASYFPPGTRIKFSFEVRDKSGAVLRTPEEDYVYQDNRFEWLTVESDLITVYYYGEYVEERAKTVLDAAEKAMERMAPILGVEPTTPLQIVSYNNYRHMSSALPFRSQAVREQLQTQGMAFTDERVLLVHGFDPTVRGTVSHEFTHLIVAEAAGRADSQVPSWLNEGLAEFGNIDPTDNYQAALRYGIYTRRLKPLWYQSSFSGTPDDIIIAYGQGQSVVNFMIQRYGPQKIAELFKALQGTLDIDLALEEVYGFDQYGLDTEWRLAIGIEPLPPPEQLERQLQGEETPEPSDPAASPTPASGESPDATPAPEASPTPEPSPVASIEDDGGGPPSPGACNSPLHTAGPIRLGLGSLMLLGTPLGLISFGLVRRRRSEYPQNLKIVHTKPPPL